jgi:hypothetical protein
MSASLSWPLRRALLRLVLISALLTACGAPDEDAERPGTQSAAEGPAPQSSPPPPATGAIDACALITSEEARAALGKPVGEPVRSDFSPVYSCTYATSDGLENVAVTAAVYEDAAQAGEAYQLALTINGYDELAGIGDRAYRGVVFDITVLTGAYELSVDVTQSVDKDVQVQKASDLARTALTRMP